MLTALLAVAGGLTVLVLFTPIEVSVRFEHGESKQHGIGLRWLFGLVNVWHEARRKTPSDASPSRKGKPNKRESARQRKHKVAGAFHAFAMLRAQGFLVGVVGLVRRIRRSIHVQVDYVRLRAGFEDPADTGFLCAWLLPLSTYAAAKNPEVVDVFPDFSGQTFDLTAAGSVRVIPARLVWPVAVFMLSPSTVRGLIASRRG